MSGWICNFTQLPREAARAFARLTDLYLAQRFGDRPPTEEGAAEFERLREALVAG